MASESPRENIPPPAYNSIYPGMPDDVSDKMNDMDYKPKSDMVKMDLSNVESLGLLLKAVDLAARRHRKQRRMDVLQTPYINHPLGVAYILSNEAKVTDLDTLIAAVLHDVVEDTKTTIDEICELFGRQVAELVRECTTDKKMRREERMEQQLRNASKLSEKAKLIELADKLYNLRDIERATPIGWSHHQKKEYIQFCKNLLSSLKGVNSALEIALDDVINRIIK